MTFRFVFSNFGLNILFIQDFLLSDLVFDLLFLFGETLTFTFSNFKLHVKVLTKMITTIFAVFIVRLHLNALFNKNLVFLCFFFVNFFYVVIIKNKAFFLLFVILISWRKSSSLHLFLFTHRFNGFHLVIFLHILFTQVFESLFISLELLLLPFIFFFFSFGVIVKSISCLFMTFFL